MFTTPFCLVVSIATTVTRRMCGESYHLVTEFCIGGGADSNNYKELNPFKSRARAPRCVHNG